MDTTAPMLTMATVIPWWEQIQLVEPARQCNRPQGPTARITPVAPLVQCTTGSDRCLVALP